MKESWNAQKKELWKMPVKALQERLQEVEVLKRKMEFNLRMKGHSNKRFGYPAITKADYDFVGGNLGHLKKVIACIKTIINQKNQ